MKIFSGSAHFEAKQINLVVVASSRKRCLFYLEKHGIRETLNHIITHWQSPGEEWLSRIPFRLAEGDVFFSGMNEHGLECMKRHTIKS